MDIIEEELAQLKKRVPEIDGCELVACVPAMVRVNIKKTQHKNVTVCFTYPETFPADPVNMEVKSKVFSDRLMAGLVKITEEEAKKVQEPKRILHMIQFTKKFVDENPLCVCSDEIHYIKNKLLKAQDEIKLKQKSSQVIVKLREGGYFLTVKITIPEEYPLVQSCVQIGEQNFPNLLRINYEAQAGEISRRCVNPPLKKKPKDPPFVPQPALKAIVEYLVTKIVRHYPAAVCPVCQKKSLPENPVEMSNDPTDPSFIERVYCGHIFHHGCLDVYMKTPPFVGGKKCPTCGQRIFHERWKATPELAEARWAHKEARSRELAEVVDFLE